MGEAFIGRLLHPLIPFPSLFLLPQYAYPWYTSVRKILDDDLYASWFIKFKPSPPYYSPTCDNNFSPPKCSMYYHMQEQTPGYPHGDGDCAPPGCDCGLKPCGFYLWNHSATEVINGQSFLQWFKDSYIFNEVGSSPLVSGFSSMITGLPMAPSPTLARAGSCRTRA